MIFKINPSFVLPHCLPVHSLVRLSVCLSFYRTDMESYKFYSIIRLVRGGFGSKRRGVKRDREGEQEGRQREKEKGVKEGVKPEERERGEWFDSGRRERQFVFLSPPEYREAFIPNPQSPAGDQSQLNSSDENAVRKKDKENSLGKKMRC